MFPKSYMEKLEDMAYHNVPVEVLKKYCNPLQCWMELDSPIKPEEVIKAVKESKAELVETPLALELALAGNVDVEKCRENHIKKIAFFVLNEPSDPISLDVGIPDMGCFVEYFIDDGNHRFAGSIIANRETIACKIGGSVDHIKELGLYFPNEAYLELEKIWDYQAEQRELERKNKFKP